MTAADLQPSSLAQLLRQLREAHGLTQRRLGEELNESRPLSPALISSWESGRAVPPDRWLEAYARTLAGPADAAGGADPVASLLSRLTALREDAAGPDDGAAVGPVGRLGGRFWHFPDGRPIRIVSTSMYPKVMEAVPYSNAFHPNYIQSLGDADMDATAELYGHLRAENPDSDVRYLTRRGVEADDLTAHLILLGGGDTLANPAEPPREPSALAWMMRRLDLPVFTRLPEGGDPEYDREFVVTLDDDGNPVVNGICSEVHRPTFLGVGGHRVEFDGEGEPVADGGYPQLEYDIGLLVRRPNPMNLSATLTLCTGVFSRGTYGVVRSLTDPQLRSRNEDYLAGHVDPDDFWLLMRIPVFHTRLGGRTVTPDLHRPFHVLRGWRDPGDLPGYAVGPDDPGPQPGPGPDR
ncbi:MAG TPA: helix-turn-helix transcriptional regulator [Kineosporiaceae bacterium]|nr:helix-turn-helix transcriptional regulator [Kineosporiaceae bacterium]